MDMDADEVKRMFQPSEDQFQRQLLALARTLGYKRVHIRKVRVMRKDGSYYWQTPYEGDGEGFPDTILAKPGRLIFAELKSKTGRLSPAQREWERILRATGQGEYYVWRFEQWNEIVRILSERPAVRAVRL